MPLKAKGPMRGKESVHSEVHSGIYYASRYDRVQACRNIMRPASVNYVIFHYLWFCMHGRGKELGGLLAIPSCNLPFAACLHVLATTVRIQPITTLARHVNCKVNCSCLTSSRPYLPYKTVYS